MSLLLLPLFAKPLVSRVPPSLTQWLLPSSGSPGYFYWSLPSSSHAHLMDIRSMFALCLDLPAVSRLLMPHLYPSDSSIRAWTRLRATQWNCASKPDKWTSRQTDRRIYFASTLRFCLDSIRSSGPGHDHSCSTQSVAIFALVTLCKALHRNAVNLFLPNRMKEMPV